MSQRASFCCQPSHVPCPVKIFNFLARRHSAGLAAHQDLYPTTVRIKQGLACPAWDLTKYCWAGCVQIWDVGRMKQVRALKGHSARVSALAWSGTTLSSGGRDSNIINHDVRCACTPSAPLESCLR